MTHRINSVTQVCDACGAMAGNEGPCTPKEPGWYWARDPRDPGGDAPDMLWFPVEVSWCTLNKQWRVFHFGNECDWPADEYVFGPRIHPPQ